MKHRLSWLRGLENSWRSRWAAHASLPGLVLLTLASAGLAGLAAHAVLGAVGHIALPLDDSFIHLQYARGFAQFAPLTYTPGGAPVAGATSLLYPALLAPWLWLGVNGWALCWVTWLYGFTSLAGLAWEAGALSRNMGSRLTPFVAACSVLCFGAFTWFAASGMEVLPFSWVLARLLRKSVEWMERESLERPGATERRSFFELVLLCWLAPLLRPEGVLGSVVAASFLLRRPFRGKRRYALAALAGVFAPFAMVTAVTGTPLLTAATTKWLPLNPYLAPYFASYFRDNVHTLLTELFDGRGWSPMFLPTGYAPVAWLGGALLGVAALAPARRVRSATLLVFAGAIFIPASYETFLVNRLRYLWPFAVPWLIGAALIPDTTRRVVSKWLGRTWSSGAEWVLSAVLLFGLASQMGETLDDLGVSARAITDQQASLGKWVRDNTPKDARIGVNDAGAIAYFGGRRTFDVVGLTTPSEAKYWVQGPGSRFEHYETLPRSELPGYFVVYPNWFDIDPLLGQLMTERSVHATILGGTRMVACIADYSRLGSAEAAPGGLEVMDRLDVADLDQEEAHGYELFWSEQSDNRVFEEGPLVDGGRAGRNHERFTLELSRPGRVIARWVAPDGLRVSVTVDDAARRAESLPASEHWQHVPVAVDLPAGRHRFEMHSRDDREFSSLHYWAVATAGSEALAGPDSTP